MQASADMKEAIDYKHSKYPGQDLVQVQICQMSVKYYRQADMFLLQAQICMHTSGQLAASRLVKTSRSLCIK